MLNRSILVTSGLLSLSIFVGVEAQEAVSTSKLIVAEWHLNVKATRDANPIKPGDSAQSEYVARILAQPRIWRFLPDGTFEAPEGTKLHKGAFKIVQSSDGELILITNTPHSSDTTLWRASITSDTLSVTPLMVDDDFSWRPAAPTLCFNRK